MTKLVHPYLNSTEGDEFFIDFSIFSLAVTDHGLGKKESCFQDAHNLMHESLEFIYTADEIT